MIKIKKGLDVPITGEPEQVIHDGPTIRSVALIGPDYNGLKPTMEVAVGDEVKKGQLLFTDKKTAGVRYTAPASGKVVAINRGAKRAFQSLVIDVEGDDEITFTQYSDDQLDGLTTQQVKDNLIESGVWTAFKTRPFSKAPEVDSLPSAVFINAMDTNPLAADPGIIVRENAEAFLAGQRIIKRLVSENDAKVFLTKANGANIPVATGAVNVEEFAGPHPAGLPGTHIHYLNPVNESKTVWTINYQDVIAIGKLFTTGKLFVERVVALGGPSVDKPRLLKTVVGANLEELTAGELKPSENRIISGSILSGRTARGAYSFLGRHHMQVSVLQEGREREFLHYLSAGTQKHSVLNIFLSQFSRSKKKFDFTTSTNGSERAMVPVCAYEKVMPLDILPTQLLRALIVGDVDTAIKLGALELDEEDLALCTYASPGKYEFGPILRDNLTLIEKEG